MSRLIDLLIGLFNCLPERVKQAALRSLLDSLLLRRARYQNIIRRNRELAFPEMTKEKVASFEEDMRESLLDLIQTSLAMPKLDKDWCVANLSWERREEFENLKRENGGKGFVIATAHLGSFELLAHGVAHLGNPLDFIVRDLKSPVLEAWLRRRRESIGNRVISRRGAFSDAVKAIEAGRDVGVLFDQNVTRRSAVFVPLFGRDAATTKLPALLSLKTGACLLFASIRKDGDGPYRMEWEQCQLDDILSNCSERDERVKAISTRLNGILETHIRRQPASWFWMHRRWKTAPEGQPEDFYD